MTTFRLVKCTKTITKTTGEKKKQGQNYFQLRGGGMPKITSRLNDKIINSFLLATHHYQSGLRFHIRLETIAIAVGR